MATDDELRQRIAAALASEMRGSSFEASATPMADALMPVVREALADAWDRGHRTSNPVIPDTHRDVINPWKQP